MDALTEHFQTSVNHLSAEQSGASALARSLAAARSASKTSVLVQTNADEPKQS